MNKEVLETNLKKLSVVISEGGSAISLLQDEALSHQLPTLLHECGNPSVFQDTSFILPWYKENLLKYSPVIVVSFDGDRLVGLLTLAREIHATNGRHCNRLIGAGNYYALYQSWNVLPEYRLDFWNKGIQPLFKKIPGCLINLKSLPDIKLFQSMEHFPKFKKMTVLEKFQNPVLDFKVEGYEKIFGKRHFKSKINRLNRAGKVKFEKITDFRVLDKLFPQIAQYYSIRQGAAFNKIPFPTGFQDWKVFLEWLKNGTLHVTCLWLDEVLIGAIMIINDFGRTAHLAGLITYSPRHAKLSPGLVHLYLVSQLLNEESFYHLKLSPGYDVYKDRFSNRQEEIYELLISKNQFQIIKRKLRVWFREILLNRSIRPMEFEVWISKTKSKWINRLWALPKKFKKRDTNTIDLLSRLNSLSAETEDSCIEYDSQSIDALLLVDDTTFDVCRWEFLEDALKRLEENEKFISYISEGKLKVCIWYKGLEMTDQDFIPQNLEKKITKIFMSPYF
jgi:hypothetical protein